MKVKFECPLDFYSKEDLSSLLLRHSLVVDDEDPEILVVNPGTEKFLDIRHFSSIKSLKVVATPSTGVNHIDVNYLKERNVKTLCLLDDRDSLDNIHASAEFTWIHIMNLCRKFSLSIKNVDSWRDKSNENFLRSNELHGKKIGIIGLGRIGKKIAKYANSFGLEIFYYDPYVNQELAPEYAKKISNLHELCQCHIISINCYLTSETCGMITWGSLDGLKEGSIVVNTSRGEVVDERYICHLIENKSIRFAADVLCGEQDVNELKKSRLLSLSKAREDVIITPHVAGATIESQKKALEAVINLSVKV